MDYAASLYNQNDTLLPRLKDISVKLASIGGISAVLFELGRFIDNSYEVKFPGFIPLGLSTAPMISSIIGALAEIHDSNNYMFDSFNLIFSSFKIIAAGGTGYMLGHHLKTWSFSHTEQTLETKLIGHVFGVKGLFLGIKVINMVPDVLIKFSDDLSGSYLFARAIKSGYKQNWDKAIHFDTKSIEYNSEDHNVLSHRGWAHFSKGAYNEAIKDFESAIALEDTQFFPHYALGVSYFNIHEYHNALREIKTAISIDPDHQLSYEYCNKIYKALSLCLPSEIREAVYQETKVTHKAYHTQWKDNSSEKETFIESKKLQYGEDIYRKIIDYLHKQEMTGDEKSYEGLALFYKNGIDVEHNTQLGTYYESAAQGDTSAFALLSSCYEMWAKYEDPEDRADITAKAKFYSKESICGNGFDNRGIDKMDVSVYNSYCAPHSSLDYNEL